MPVPSPATRLLSRDFLLLWGVGAVGNAMRWLEVLAAALFTLEVTGSELAVALVSAARSLPLIFTAAIAGVLADAIDRRLIVAGGLLLSGGGAAAVAVLSGLGVLQPWHLFIASLLSGLVYGTDMSARRRMLGESVAGFLAPRAIALDSLTVSASRFAGPLLGGAAYEFLGLTGTFAASALLSLAAAAAALRVRHAQVPRRLSVAMVAADLAEALGVVRRSAVLATLVLVTLGQNLFGFAYTTLIAPAGRDVFGVSAAMVGVLAAAEPAGGTLGGIAVALFGMPKGRPIKVFMFASAWFLAMLMLTATAPWFWATAGLLFTGGLALALYSNHQTNLALTEAPEAVRSRVMGLISTAIGGWPIGMLLAGWLADRTGPLRAMGMLGAAGLLWVAAIAARGVTRAARTEPLSRP